MDLTGKHVVVVGLAQTGICVANFCRERGARVTVSDGKPAAQLEARVAQLEGCELDLGGHTVATFTDADLVVMSPGVPELDATRAAREAGVEVIAEIELAYRFLHPGATLIAITGTNGKSTTTALTGLLCEASGRPTFCGGNLGNHPLIEAVNHSANCEGGLIVAEVAGFMLETCTSFRPSIAACLNISPDHLERYGTFDVYASMKTRIFAWLEESDHAIANACDARTMEGATGSPATLHLFDSTPDASPALGASIDREEDKLLITIDKLVEHYPIGDLPIIGNHNMENAMAAYLCARLAGVEPGAIRKGARAFTPQKHRMELVGEEGGVQYFDDSKGTNVAAVAASLKGFPRKLVLIAGGVDKGGAYDEMFDVLAQVATGMVLIGQAAPIIRKAAEDFGVDLSVVDAIDMNDAVAKATDLANEGEAVVLSPACSSYDMYKNFGERGMAFRAALETLSQLAN
ncbi:MAG: UDP-N-acetylmuramoyl-L-alanine--D-glutamate ligase [Myxococcales bacterium]|nr:UDP-N-acetylmuramoyl-L-alanine--D-glutamate ligase [Myxococcales bacterium]